MTIIVIAVILVIIWSIFTYNGFVSLRNRADNAWSDVDVQLTRRHDLVPNLVAVVQGYAAPLWQVQYEDGKTVYITQQGRAYNSLTINNAVNRQ